MSLFMCTACCSRAEAVLLPRACLACGRLASDNGSPLFVAVIAAGAGAPRQRNAAPVQVTPGGVVLPVRRARKQRARTGMDQSMLAHAAAGGGDAVFEQALAPVDLPSGDYALAPTGPVTVTPMVSVPLRTVAIDAEDVRRAIEENVTPAGDDSPDLAENAPPEPRGHEDAAASHLAGFHAAVASPPSEAAATAGQGGESAGAAALAPVRTPAEEAASWTRILDEVAAEDKARDEAETRAASEAAAARLEALCPELAAAPVVALTRRASEPGAVAALAQAFDPEVRRTYLGGSEVAAALGLSRWKTPIGLWAEKVGLTPPIEDSDVLEWGRLLEPVILDRWSRKMATPIIRPTERDALEVRHAGGWLRGHLDGLAARERTCPDCGTTGTPVLEAKAPGFRSAHLWGEPCSDLVPDDYGLQAQVYMGLYDREQCDLYAPVGGPDWRVYHLHFDRDLFDAVVAAAGKFWAEHVVANVRPELDGTESTAKYLAHAFPAATPKTLADPSDESNALAIRLRTARAEVAKWTGEKKLAENGFKALIGDRAGMVGPDYAITWGNVIAKAAGKGAYVAALNAMAAEYGMLLEYVRGLDIALPDGIGAEPQLLLAQHIKPGAGFRRFVPKFTGADAGVTDSEED